MARPPLIPGDGVQYIDPWLSTETAIGVPLLTGFRLLPQEISLGQDAGGETAEGKDVHGVEEILEPPQAERRLIGEQDVAGRREQDAGDQRSPDRPKPSAPEAGAHPQKEQHG